MLTAGYVALLVKLLFYPMLYRIRFMNYTFLFVVDLYFFDHIVCIILFFCFAAFAFLKDYSPLHVP